MRGLFTGKNEREEKTMLTLAVTNKGGDGHISVGDIELPEMPAIAQS